MNKCVVASYQFQCELVFASRQAKRSEKKNKNGKKTLTKNFKNTVKLVFFVAINKRPLGLLCPLCVSVVQTCANANPCHNRGTCVPGAKSSAEGQGHSTVSKFHCVCQHGYQGPRCELGKSSIG